MKQTTYGQKGGQGPTRGLTATNWLVTLPDGRTVPKRTFGTVPQVPTGYAYKHDGQWYLAGVSEPNNPLYDAFVSCPAKRRD
jgi:hypothetical protein